MAIEYAEIRDESRQIVGIIDTANSIIWHSVYWGVGDFEIYCKATPEHIDLLKQGYYVTIPNDLEVGIIEKIEVTNTTEDGLMIAASGRFAKCVLDRRLIYQLSGKTNTPTILRGNVEANIRNVVSANAINCRFDTKRNIPVLELGASSGLPAVIVDENGQAAQKQVSYEGLLEYTEQVLQEYGYASIVLLNDDTKKLQYVVYSGENRSMDNTSGNELVIFSREYDNLTETDYQADNSAEKNTALVGGEGEGLERFYSLLAGTQQGLERKELWVDGSSLSQTLEADELQEMFPSGSFVGIEFRVNGTVYATLVYNLEKEYTLANLQEKFPTGTASGTRFTVGGVVYANKKYGDDNKYQLTPLGFKAMLDAEDETGEYKLSDQVYRAMLNALGKQSLASMIALESFSGKLNVTFGNWTLNQDYFLGDIVTVQDNQIGKYVNSRITEITEVQDENGYSVEATFE